MNWTLEVVVVPVSDVDRAKAFYADELGFNLDHDSRMGKGNRVVQLTPPGSGCSIVIGEGVAPDMAPGSLKGLQLVVPDLNAARAQLAEHGVDVSEIQVMGESPACAGSARQCRVRLLQRSRRQRVGGTADLGPGLGGWPPALRRCRARRRPLRGRPHGLVRMPSPPPLFPRSRPGRPGAGGPRWEWSEIRPTPPGSRRRSPPPFALAALQLPGRSIEAEGVALLAEPPGPDHRLA